MKDSKFLKILLFNAFQQIMLDKTKRKITENKERQQKNITGLFRKKKTQIFPKRNKPVKIKAVI